MRVEVRNAIALKNKKLAKLIPRFIIKLIEKIVYQDEINTFLASHDKDNPFDFAKNTIEVAAQCSYEIINEENIPKTGRVIVVSNHPLGGIDGVALIAALGKYRKDIKLPANDLIMQIEPLQELLIPINKHGKSSREVSKKFNDVFASDDLIIYFPAGLCSRKIDGKIMDTEWKKTVLTKAKEYKRDIVPLYFDGKNTDRFYNIARWRKRLGIKFNIEMLFLPAEVFRHKGEKFKLTFGELIPYQTFNNSKTDSEWIAWLKDQVYALNK
ncbi:MAG: glycerol acyltransferase [Bacteroidetes bacterium HGW-Bacteroidetes-20]|nr:MAG: glycerol acyltransferase [Bacteroidetes bacterium HGW-Bacteroidetes-20]